jgi:lipoyl(octanoyl) transferase
MLITILLTFSKEKLDYLHNSLNKGNKLVTVEWKRNKGLLDYNKALLLMEERVLQIASGKKEELVWLVEHPPLYTAGTSAKPSDLLKPDKFKVFHTGRGGEFTYHGPGQRVVYVMLNLKKRGAEDIRAYVHNLEQWIINSLALFGIEGTRKDGRIGIWVDTNMGEAKIAALGIRVRKWVTYHGISINLSPNLSHFDGIIPCGISKYGVTSFAELGNNSNMQSLDMALEEEFYKIF